MSRQWRLGEDVAGYDNMLDGFTFDDLILALKNCREISPDSARRELNEILDSRLEDMHFLFEKNLDVIISEAQKR